MKVLRAWLRRALDLLRRRRRERELAEELDSHLALHIADNLRAGMTSQEARRQAILALGGIESTKEAYREQRGLPWLETTAQDVRYALRGLRRSPGFAVTAVVTLALGIGATTAIFSAVYALLIRPLPYRDPGKIVYLAQHVPGAFSFDGFPAADIFSIQQHVRSFSAVAAYNVEEHTLTGAGEAARIPGGIVSWNLLDLLGTRPQLGRTFDQADGTQWPQVPAVAMISHTLWQQKFGSDPKVVGRAIHLEEHAFTVIGILAPSFRFPDMANAPAVLIPMAVPSAFDMQHGFLLVRALARLRDNVTASAAAEEMQRWQKARLRDYPPMLGNDMHGVSVEVSPLQRHLAGDSRTPALVLLAAVGFVLLIACANIANLQLVRAAARRHEVAVRGALGAPRRRLARQFLTESLTISALAAAAGLAIGDACIRLIRGLHSPAMPWLDTVSLDPYVFAFALAIAVIAALGFGAAPAISGSRANLMDALKATSLRMSGSHNHPRLRRAFVVGEIALAMVLLVAAGLLVRSFRDLVHTDPGYDPSDVLSATLTLPLSHFTGGAGEFYDHTRIAAFVSALIPKLRALPGVSHAALCDQLPLDQEYELRAGLWFGTTPPREHTPMSQAPLISVTPDFFRAMRTPLLEGRGFDVDDNDSSPAVAIVNRAFARQFFAGQALGKRFHSMVAEHCAGCVRGKGAELLVVGVSSDTRHGGLDQPAQPEVYVPFAQAPRVHFHIVLSTWTAPGVLATLLRKIVSALDDETPVYDIATLEQRLNESLAQRRLTMFLLSAFAALALLLAAIGVYGVISYAVVQRTQEIGIRVALGATRAGVLRLVVGQQARMVILGGVVGLALAWAAGGVLSSLLYGVTAHDAATFVISWVALTFVALLASAAPALRATRTDPCEALRYE